MWNSKFMGWIERKLIDLTSSVYLKRRETPIAVVEDAAPKVAPTLQRSPVEPTLTKKRTFVKRNEAPKKAAPKAKTQVKPATKAKPAAIKAKPANKKAVPAKAKPATKAAKPVAKPKAKK